MKPTFLIIILLVLSSTAFAAEPLLESPRWSLEIKGGMFAPALENWSRNFGNSGMREFEASFAYKLLQQVELGAEAGRMKSKGQVFNQFHGNPVGTMTYELRPVNIFIMLRGAVIDGQWVVPYVGGGWTRMYYHETGQDRETTRGSADGYHFRGGLQLSLDNMDQTAANRMYADYRVFHTFFFIEAEYIRAVVRSTSINIGGKTYLAGLLFEL